MFQIFGIILHICYQWTKVLPKFQKAISQDNPGFC